MGGYGFWEAMNTRERRNFDTGWRFAKGDPANATAQLTYERMRPWLATAGLDLLNPIDQAKAARPAEEPVVNVPYVEKGFDDSEWRSLDLPHDWGIEGGFDQSRPADTGKLPWPGIGWYRKSFSLAPSEIAERRVELEFDGAMSLPLVWLNGRFVGGWIYGYSSFRVDLTDALSPDGENVLVVRLHNKDHSSRWYPGSGLYRHVWLSLSSPLRFAPWGIQVTTPRVDSDRALVQLDMMIEQLGDEEVEIQIETELFELSAEGECGDGAIAGASTKSIVLNPARGRQTCRSQSMEVDVPRLWSPNTPNRYLAVTRILINGSCVDEVDTPFGIRKAEWDAEKGFVLNDSRVAIKGVCLHHDLGALGAAVNTCALERQLRILREMGCNAIRTAHNPPAPEQLDLCDRMGFLVMVESFDCWRLGKRENDYSQYFDDWHERDLRAMVRRDRNHPSVVIWSIGNEVLEQYTNDGWKLAQHLAAIVRSEDKSREVTMGCSVEASAYTGYQVALDVVGFNYKPWAYPLFRDQHPMIPLYGSETSSCVSSRGEYVFPVSRDKSEGQQNFHVSSYDLSAPPWAWTPDKEFAGLDDAPYTAGEFVWTGFDYLGEPTPFNSDATNLLNFSDPEERARMAEQLEALGKIEVPSRSSYFGILDLAGFPKDRFFLYQARWREEFPVAHLLPHWNWPERIGEVTPVHLYSNGDEAELFLNDVSQGRKQRSPKQYRFEWDSVVYEPGELRAEVWRGGKKWIQTVQNTTGDSAKLQVEVDRDSMDSTRSDFAFVSVAVVDAGDRVVPRAQSELHFSVSGPIELVALDSGDPTSHAPFASDRINAFNGRALAIVRPRKGGSGQGILTVQAGALLGATCSFDVFSGKVSESLRNEALV